MKVFKELSELKNLPEPIVLSIGVYDGLHRGHLSVLKRVKEITKNQGTSIVISFSNHPLEVLQQKKIPFICPTNERISLFEKLGIDILFLIPFTQELSHKSAEDFVKWIKTFFSFSYLVLGFDAVLGNKREGTPEKMHFLGTKLNFTVEYLPPVSDENGPISSTRIRTHLQNKQIKEAEKLLGRTLYDPSNHSF